MRIELNYTETYQYMTIVAIRVPVLCGMPVQSLLERRN